MWEVCWPGRTWLGASSSDLKTDVVSFAKALLAAHGCQVKAATSHRHERGLDALPVTVPSLLTEMGVPGPNQKLQVHS